MKQLSSFVLGVWLSLYLVYVSDAQEILTNMQVFENLGLECLGEVPVEADSLILSPSPSLPYLTTRIINYWDQQGKILFLSDSLSISTSHSLISWDIPRAAISYKRQSRRMVSRSAKLDLNYSYIDKYGEFRAHDSCQMSLTDEIPRNMIPSLESSAYLETQAEPPHDRWIRRYLEPLIIGAVTGLAAFLFFNLRNDSADS